MSALVHAPQLAAVTTPSTVPPALMDALQITVPSLSRSARQRWF